jgi:glycosyltransferase involved in cell wall biosynthesis
MGRKKIAVIHPGLHRGGGSEAVAMWIMASLQYDHDVELITVGRPDIRLLNDCYDTNLVEGRIGIIPVTVPRPLRGHFDALRGHLLARRFWRLSKRYDLTISAYNILGLRSKGLQFVGDLSFDDDLRRRFDPHSTGRMGILYRMSILRGLYLLLGKLVSGPAIDGWKNNVTIANSSWTARILKEVYGLTADVIYPPVYRDFPDLPWDQREDGFVCVGRLVPEKRIELILDILDEVRSAGLDIHLHIVGTSNDSRYQEHLRDLCRKKGRWAFFEGGLFGDQKNNLIARHKFGIHGRLNEPFGIAPAEMVGAGCLVWVPNGGGQVEIVNHAGLIYENQHDASVKIAAILNDQGLQAEIRAHLRRQARNFSAERFVHEVKCVVTRILESET